MQFSERGELNAFLYFPAFYTAQSALEQSPAEALGGAGLRRYAANWHTDSPTCPPSGRSGWWVHAQLLNFGFSPLWLRTPFTAVVSGLWTSYISLTRGNFELKGGDEPD